MPSGSFWKPGWWDTTACGWHKVLCMYYALEGASVKWMLWLGFRHFDMGFAACFTDKSSGLLLACRISAQCSGSGPGVFIACFETW